MAKPNQVKLVTEVVNNMLHDSSKPWTEVFERVETKTGVPRLKLLMGSLLAILVSLRVFGTTAMVLSNAIGFIYPAYATMSLMIRPPKWHSYNRAAAAVEVQNKRFTYWFTFCALLIVEQVCGFVLLLFPWYLLFRTLFLVWCFTPIRKSGMALIYNEIKYKIFKVNIRTYNLYIYMYKLLLPNIIVLLLFGLC